jgi:hypothetical protein
MFIFSSFFLMCCHQIHEQQPFHAAGARLLRRAAIHDSCHGQLDEIFFTLAARAFLSARIQTLPGKCT